MFLLGRAWMLAAVACAMVSAGLRAQEPAVGPEPAAGPEPIFTRQTAFSIPFQVDKNAANPPVEVQLHVSPDRGGRWDIYDKVKPDRGSFVFRAPHDGEYWFCIRSTDKQGAASPSGQMTAGLKVIVDTLAPRLDVTAERLPAGELSAQWQSVDPVLKPESLKIEYCTGDAGEWQELAANQARITEGRSTLSGDGVWWPQDAPGAVTLRIQISDRAGNPAVTQVLVRAPGDVPAQPTGEVGPSLGAPAGTTDTARSMDNSREVDVTRRDTRTFPIATGATTDTNIEANPFARYKDRPNQIEETAPSQPALSERPPQNRAWPAQQAPTRPLDTSNDEQSWRVGNLPGGNRQPGFVHTGSGGGRDRARVAEVSGGSLGRPATNRFDFADLSPAERPKMVNSRTFQVEYEVESVGSAGVAKVELFGTRDGGETWSSLGTDPDNRSPLVVTVNGEGLYGFAVVVQSASGLSGSPPRAGDRPDLWIGVDLTKPQATLTGAEAGNNPDELVIYWDARDARLESRPISLSFANQRGGPWTPIASALENTSSYTWRMDNRVREQIYLKLEARDEAGNLGVFETAEPISLNRQLPQGRIRGVRPVEPEGNNGQARRPAIIENQFAR